MIKVCLVGCGRMGQGHARNIASSPFASLYCVVDTNPENARIVAERHGSKVYNTLDEALQDKSVDAVAIVTNTATHCDAIIKSAKAGKPIFCEKPIDLDLQKVESCLDVVETCGVPFLVGFNRRFDPSVSGLKHGVEKGSIGSIEMLSISSRDNPLPSIEYLKTSGGLFADMTIHDFDMARWLLGDEPVEVFAAGGCLVDGRIAEFGDIDTAMVTLKTAKGVLCHINNSRRAVYGYDQRIEAFGSKGMLRVNNIAPTSLERSGCEGIKTEAFYPGFLERYEKAYQLELKHFFHDVVQEGRPPLVSGVDGKQALVIAEAAQKSLLEGRPVSIPSMQKKSLLSV